MKKSVLAALTAATLSVVSPLALAHAGPVESTQASYLASRANMDSPEAIAQAVAQIRAQQKQAARIGDNDVQSLAVAGRESLDGMSNINAVYEH